MPIYTAKHSLRDDCSIVLFIPYYVLLSYYSICYTSMSPGLPTTHPPMVHDPGAPRIHQWVAQPMGDPLADPPMGLSHRTMGQIDRWRVTYTPVVQKSKKEVGLSNNIRGIPARSFVGTGDDYVIYNYADRPINHNYICNKLMF